MRIAILEDDPDQLALIKRWVSEDGHDVHAFLDGRETMKQAGRESFDLFVLDWQVPDVSGADVLKWLRANVSKSVPVLFVTVRDSEQDIVFALEQGAEDRRLHLPPVDGRAHEVEPGAVHSLHVSFQPGIEVSGHHRELRRADTEVALGNARLVRMRRVRRQQRPERCERRDQGGTMSSKSTGHHAPCIGEAAEHHDAGRPAEQPCSYECPG